MHHIWTLLPCYRVGHLPWTIKYNKTFYYLPCFRPNSGQISPSSSSLPVAGSPRPPLWNKYSVLLRLHCYLFVIVAQCTAIWPAVNWELANWEITSDKLFCERSRIVVCGGTFRYIDDKKRAILDGMEIWLSLAKEINWILARKYNFGLVTRGNEVRPCPEQFTNTVTEQIHIKLFSLLPLATVSFFLYLRQNLKIL